MYRLGVCADIRCADAIAQIGYDFIEAPLYVTARMSADEYVSAKQRLLDSGIECEVMNAMLPPDIPVVGPSVNAQKIHEYLDPAFARAAELGAKVIVMSSGRSRDVPAGFSFDQAWRQLANFLRMAEQHAREYRLIVAVQPLRRAECNMINFLTEATALTAIVNMPHIGVAGDIYHMRLGSEQPETFSRAGKLLCHVHIANAIGRKFPAPGDGEDYEGIFAALRKARYPGRVSIEARTDDLLRDAATALRLLDGLEGA